MASPSPQGLRPSLLSVGTEQFWGYAGLGTMSESWGKKLWASCIIVLHLGLFFLITEIPSGKRSCENHLTALAAAIPHVQFFQNPADIFSGCLKCTISFQKFTAFQDAFLWHATVFPDFTQNFPLERKHILSRLVLSSVLLTTRNWIRPCKKPRRPLAIS